MRIIHLFLLGFPIVLAVGCRPAEVVVPAVPRNETNLRSFQAPSPRYATTTWRRFIDSHLSFQYPADWKLEENESPRTNAKVISLIGTNGFFSAQDSPRVPISITYTDDTFHGLIANYIPDEAFRTRAETGVTTIGGHTAYVFQDFASVESHDFRVVFAGSLVYEFVSNAKVVNASAQDQQAIALVFETMLSTVKFK
jgi:hypothetical protein